MSGFLMRMHRMKKLANRSDKLFVSVLSIVALCIATDSSWADNAKSAALNTGDKNVIEIYEVDTKEGDRNPYLQVATSHELFSFSHKTDLSDLIAMDSGKNILPYRLVAITPNTEVADEEIARSHLPFIPVATDMSPDALRELQTTQVKKSKDKLQVVTETQTLNNQTPEFYLIDLKALEQDSNQLEIHWQPAAQAEYVEVEVEATRNLEEWESLGKKMLVQSRAATLEKTDKDLEKTDKDFLDNRLSISLTQNEYDYLRIKVVRGADFFKLTDVIAIQIKKQIHRLMPQQEIWTIEGTEAVKQEAVQQNTSAAHQQTAQAVAAWEYTRNETTPAESLALDIADFSYSDTISLYSRANEKQNWQLVYRGPWIHVQVGDQWQTGDAISLYKNQHKYWRLEMDQGMRGSASPKLNFLWHPYQLQIIASNKPPFHLAIDMQSAGNKPTETIFNQLIEKANPVWSQAQLVSLNVDPEYTQQTVSTGSSYKEYLFWAALLAAVIILFIFSWKLIRELQQNPDKLNE